MKLCAECGNKPAIFKIKNRGKVHADKWHDLCFRCSKAWINRNRSCDERKSLAPSR